MNKSLAMISLALMLAACSSSDEVVATESEAEVEVIEPVEAEPHSTVADQLPIPETFSQAVEVYTPKKMEYYNEFPTVLAFFALWNEKAGLDWTALNSLESTTYGKVMKDPFMEYGKLMCVNGTIYEISTDRSMAEPLYNGSIATDSMDIYRFTAVGSSGDLIAQSRAKFCGVVAAKFSYENAIGGTTHSPYLFGMFDLPENK